MKIVCSPLLIVPITAAVATRIPVLVGSTCQNKLPVLVFDEFFLAALSIHLIFD